MSSTWGGLKREYIHLIIYLLIQRNQNQRYADGKINFHLLTHPVYQSRSTRISSLHATALPPSTSQNSQQPEPTCIFPPSPKKEDGKHVTLI